MNNNGNVDNGNISTYSSPSSSIGNGYEQQLGQTQEVVQSSNMSSGYGQSSVQNVSNDGYMNNDVSNNINIVTNGNVNTNTNMNMYSDKKGNKNIKKGLLIVGLILVLGVIAFVGYRFFTKDKENVEFDINDTTAFFLKDSNAKYALFNKDGKRLTEFIYTSIGSFVNGTAVVQMDDKKGIISIDGKMVVDFDRYKYIYSVGGLYQVTDSEYNQFLINSDGRVLYDLEDVNVKSFMGINTFVILEFEEEEKYTVVNFKGDELVTFPLVEDVKDPSVNEMGDYITVFYNKKNFVFNVITGKQVVTFDTDIHYCVNNSSDDGKIITLNSCVTWFQSQDKTYYKFIKDGKLYDLTSQCDSISYRSDNLMCKKDSITYLLDNNLNRGIDIANKAYSSNNSYVMNNIGSFNGVDFYKGGKVVKNVSCRSLKETGYMNNELYILGTYYSRDCDTVSGSYEFYDANGNRMFGKSFERVEKFDWNGLAKVSDDGDNYYMIDEDGKRVGGSYTSIALSGEYYIVTKDNLRGIMDSKGNEIVSCENEKIEISTKDNKSYANIKVTDGEYIVYDLDKKKEILKLDGYPWLQELYIEVSYSSEKKHYYTYSGKMFYEL